MWQLPLETKRYRKLLDSDVADVKNVGGPYGGAITAAVFLSEFVGDVPWAHLDIAGPMKVDADESWRSKGATGFGTRLLDRPGDELQAGRGWRDWRLSSSQASAAAGGRDADGDELRLEQAAVVAGGEHRRGQGVGAGEGVEADRRRRPLLVRRLELVGQAHEVALGDRAARAGARPRPRDRRWATPNITQRCSALANGDAIPFVTLRPRARAVPATSSS